MREVEYRVRPVTRFVVTRWYHEDQEGGRQNGGSEVCGEFENMQRANKVCEALAAQEPEAEAHTMHEPSQIGDLTITT
jgi:hypothetical protein